MHNRQRKKSKLIQKLTYCLWFLVFIVFAGFSVFLVAKYAPSERLRESSQAMIKTAEHGREIIMSELEPLLHHVKKPSPVSSPIIQPDSKSTTKPPTPISPVSRQKPVTSEYREIDFHQVHFIHIPKCGGTTMTAVLRQLMCLLDEVKNKDCCTNPGFCDWHAFRRCANIKGCINHFPNRKLIYQKMPSIAVFREPTSRLISAFYYRGHSPNLDFFQVRPEFKAISEGKKPRVVFKDYIEMVEYQNIFTRMLGADSFPYRNISITKKVYEKALDAVKHIDFVMLQEEFDVSTEILRRAMHLEHHNITVTKERGNEGKSIREAKSQIKRNIDLMQRVREANSYDVKLYSEVVRKFCDQITVYPDLMQKVKDHATIQCFNR